jgi:hypothetical protein
MSDGLGGSPEANEAQARRVREGLDRAKYRRELDALTEALDATIRERIEKHLGPPNTNSGTPSSTTFAVIPEGKPTEPVVMGLSRADAESAARNVTARASTRMGRGSSGTGPGRFVVVRDATVAGALEAADESLAEAKVRRGRRRESNRAAAERYRQKT